MNTFLNNREEWLKMRKNYIGASDAPVIMNGHHFEKTPYKLWKEKLGIGEGTPDNKYMKFGRDNEEVARQAYEKKTGSIMNPEIVFHPHKKFMMATLDGMSPYGDRILEIKNAGAEDHATAQEGKVPAKYYPQLQHQLACTPINRLDYWSYHRGDGILVEVERDEKYIDNLYEKEESFWDMVLQLEAPEMTDKDYEDKERCLEWMPIARRWSNIRQKLDSLSLEEKACRKLLIGLSDGSAVGHGVRLTKFIRKGCVDYKAIPELSGVNLESYRKDPVEAYRISITK